MGKRLTLKNLKSFAKEELKEKRPKKVEVRQNKKEKTMQWGKFPNLRVKSSEGFEYLVISDYSKNIKIYFFDGTGKIISSEKYEGSKTKEIRKKIEKNTKTVFKFED